MLEIQNLSKKFKDHKVIDMLNTTFSEIGVSVIVGGNGSGKTTLLHMITHLLQPDTGQILLDGLQPSNIAYKSKFFYLPSDFYLPHYMTGKEYTKFVLSRYAASNYDHLVWLLELLDMTTSQNKMLESYSFGMKKKIQIAAAVAANTDYIFADEILGGLDFETVLLVQAIFAKISQRKKIILVSHDQNTIDCFPEDIRVMRQGKLIPFTGSPYELTTFIKQDGVLRDKLCDVEKYFSTS